jgi:hypothetical protein
VFVGAVMHELCFLFTTMDAAKRSYHDCTFAHHRVGRHVQRVGPRIAVPITEDAGR